MCPLTGVNCFCAVFSCACMVLIVIFSSIMGAMISGDSGGGHVVTTEPRYDDAGHQAGYFDAAGVYQGGLPMWHDWTEDYFACQDVSANGMYCQQWSTERYHSNAEEEFLKGNCTCDLTAETDSSRSFYHWLDYNLSSEEFDALDKASFCTAWSCEETRFKQACECNEYETQTSCTNSKTSKSSRSKNKSGSCRTYESCISYNCKYNETPYYTTCNCDHGGKKRLERGPYWFNDSPFCSDWTCYQGHRRYSYDEDEEKDDDAIHDSKHTFWQSVARTYPTSRSASRKPKWIIVADTELSYDCSEVDESGKWCAEWRGVSSEYGDYSEQLCECFFNGTTNGNLSEEFCQDWVCTSYHMEKCSVSVKTAPVCLKKGQLFNFPRVTVVGVIFVVDDPVGLSLSCGELCNTVGGILLGTLILLCMMPLVTGGCLGYYTQACISIPCGLAAAALLAAFIGGIPAILEGIIAASIMVFILGGVLSMVVPKPDKKNNATTAAPTAVLPTPGPNQPVINYGQTMPLSQMHVQSQQQQQAMYPVSPALGGMQPVAVTYPGTVVNTVGGTQGMPMQYSPPGSPVGLSSSYGSGPVASVATASSPVGYQSHSSNFERVTSYGSVPGTSGQPSYYTGPGGSPSPQTQGLGGPAPHQYMGGQPPHQGFGAGTQQYVSGASSPQYGYGPPPTHYGPGGL